MSQVKNTLGALRWITDILQSNNIPFQITGGLAAKVYGSERELADIDIDIPEEYFDSLHNEVRAHIIFGPSHFKDQHWDLQLMTLDYEGQLIDIGGASVKIFSQTKKSWMPFTADIATAEQHEIFNMLLPVMRREDLLWYKAILDREVDREDIAQIKRRT